MHKITLFLFLFAGALGYALFSFFGTYSSCHEAHRKVDSAYSDLVSHGEELTSLSVKMGAFALKYLPNGRSIVNKMETTAQNIRIHNSVSDLAVSCGKLYSSMKKVAVLLDADIQANKNYRFQDAKLQFDKISRDLSLAGKKYNNAAIQYNITLQQPLPQFWRFMFNSEPAQLFKAKKKS